MFSTRTIPPLGGAVPTTRRWGMKGVILFLK